MNRVAIVTARGGSKRIPRKNIRAFHGKPIIAYSIEAALLSGLFTEVMVSTDDDEIKAIAESFGAKVPFMRSAKNANDHSTTANVLEEVLSAYKEETLSFAEACCLYPTAPFVTAEKLIQAQKTMEQSNADVVFPVVKFEASIWRSLRREGNGKLQFNWPENAVKRSQDLTDAYYDCGQFYFFNVASFLQKKTLLTDNTFGLPVPAMEVQDIDNEEDWQLAEFKYSFQQLKSKYKTDGNV